MAGQRRGVWLLCGVVLLTTTAWAQEGGTELMSPLKVEIGESFVISKSSGRHWFPTLGQISPEELLAKIWCTEDAIDPERTSSAYRWTRDGGLTWSKAIEAHDMGHSWAKLADGSYLSLSYCTLRTGVSTCSCGVGRSSGGLNYSWSRGSVDVAPLKLGDWGKGGAASIVFARSVLLMPDGALLATMYGRFEGDALDRSIAVHSTDGGTSWKYLATIGYDAAVGGEGLNEPCMVRLADGDLYCVMRNLSGKPMYSARSGDDGRTWSAPKIMPEQAMSVFASLCVMSNGVLACSSGRPGCRIMFSPDGKGEQWTEGTTVFDGPSTCYTAIAEVAPGKLLYVYDVVPTGWDAPKPDVYQEIRGVYITVHR